MHSEKSNSFVWVNESRLLSLDFMRGIAIIGMIFVNVLAFLPDFRLVLLNDTLAEQTIANGTLYEIIFVLFYGKMRALFTLLFGAGIVLFFKIPNESESSRADLFASRMLWLLILGLAHAYFLLWPGTILFEYALGGLLLFSLRNLRPSKILVLSIAVLSLYFYINSKDYPITYQKYLNYEEAIACEKQHKPLSQKQIADKEKFENTIADHPPFSAEKELEIKESVTKKKTLYGSGFKEIYKQNTSICNDALSFGVYMNILESIGTMLLGLFLFKIGFFEFKFKRNTYLLISLLGITLGILLSIQIYKWQSCPKSELIAIYAWKNFNTFTIDGIVRIVQTIGYCALFMLTSQLKQAQALVILIANMGKMALTNYVMQTSLAVIFFYGLHYYGNLQMLGYCTFSLCLIALQLLISTLCINYFKTGPLEYWWRKISKQVLKP